MVGPGGEGTGQPVFAGTLPPTRVAVPLPMGILSFAS